MSISALLPAETMPPHRVGSPAAMDDLAGRINAEHEACLTAMVDSIGHAIAAGNLLVEARRQVGHGGWSAWVLTHCRLSLRQAQKYMRVAKGASRGAFEAGRPESLRHALAMLTAPDQAAETRADLGTAAETRAISPAPDREPTAPHVEMAAGISRDEAESEGAVVPGVAVEAAPSSPVPRPEAIWSTFFDALAAWSDAVEGLGGVEVAAAGWEAPQREYAIDRLGEGMRSIATCIQALSPGPPSGGHEGPQEDLTRRNAEILRLADEGVFQRAIGARFGLSQGHVSAILKAERRRREGSADER